MVESFNANTIFEIFHKHNENFTPALDELLERLNLSKESILCSEDLSASLIQFVQDSEKNNKMEENLEKMEELIEKIVKISQTKEIEKKKKRNN